MNIIEVIPKENHLLYVKTEDGKSGIFDMKPFLDSEAFAPLKEDTVFRRIHNGKYFIEWDCGADLSADTILARWSPLFSENTQQGAPADDRTSHG